MTYNYKIDNWSGLEDVDTLCASYLDEVQDPVADGIKKSFVSG